MKVSDMNKQQKIFTFVVLPIILLIAIIIVNIIFSGEEDNSQQETVIGLNTSLPQTTSNIQEQKIAEARRQLETTNLPLSQIAMQLNFSSQNYFHHVFKKITGVTPNQYAQKQH